MDSYRLLLDKLESFIRRYYKNELIKGGILFLSAGLVYLILTLSVEHFLWLDPLGRAILFWTFVLVELLLLIRFLVIPVLKLVKLSEGLGRTEAARIIGSHFPEVKDKLLNVLQLNNSYERSELLVASIDQKAKELQPIPFGTAIDFKLNIKYLKYALVPVLLAGLIVFSGNSRLFADSYSRVVDYKTEYERPAPFAFHVLNSSLLVQEKETFTLEVQILGSVLPESPMLQFNDQSYYLTEVSKGKYEYPFEAVEESFLFRLSANGIVSQDYEIEVVKVPRLLDFEMALDYPAYTGLEDEIISGSGNATVAEGTKVEWKLKTRATTRVEFIHSDTIENLEEEGGTFNFKKDVYSGLNYIISTSNSEVFAFEQLEYELEVIKDAYPVLDLRNRRDSLEREPLHFFGRASDDYGISKVELVYQPLSKSSELETVNIDISNGSYTEFMVSFPDTLSLEEGTEYELYFQVYDNDGLRNGKMVRSSVFSYRNKTAAELKDDELRQQEEVIRSLDSSLDQMEKSEEELEDLRRLQKEKGQLDFNEKRELEKLFKRQEEQNKLMKSFSEQLMEDFDAEGIEEERNQDLKKNLEDREKHLEENEKLLEELKRYSEKFSEEELGKKLEELSKRGKYQEKSLKQLLELTKRYYIEEKWSKLNRDLDGLGEEQEKISKASEENGMRKQDSLNSAFKKFREEMNELKEEMKNLAKPMELGGDPDLEDDIEKSQREASEHLNNSEEEKGREAQKKASDEMRELAEKMRQQQGMSSMQQMQEDSDMLRQILDNLLIFSIEQEELLKKLQNVGRNDSRIPEALRRQNSLKDNFRHIDDSLYSLALRNPMLTDRISESLTNIEFDIEKALERLAESELSQGMGSQQYVITRANDLAYILEQILSNMQDKLQPSGSGGGEDGPQLPDLIKEQEALTKEMGEKTERRKQTGGTDEGEEEMGELFRIYQKQQAIRRALEKELKDLKSDKTGEGVAEEMEVIEEEILENGFNERTVQRMQELGHKLLELNDARLREGWKDERESRHSNIEFEDDTKNQILRQKEYFNTSEILNRQSLPLRQNYQLKVKEYFERRND